MRRGAILWLLAVLAVSGCGGGRAAPRPTTTVVAHTDAQPGFRVGVVGPLVLDVPGVVPRHGRLARVADEQLVLVDARVRGLDAVARVARAHPASHFALVGASARSAHVRNLAGLVLRLQDAAFLAGYTAGLSATETVSDGARVAWVGPEERALAVAFGRGVHAAAPSAAVLHQWSRSVPARCKEAALTAIGRGALVVMAHGGLCADAAASGAHEQNLPALRLGDFLFPSVAAGLVARDASRGAYHGGQDVVFGPQTGAVGVRVLDTRISPATAARARAAAQDLARGITPAG